MPPIWPGDQIALGTHTIAPAQVVDIVLRSVVREAPNPRDRLLHRPPRLSAATSRRPEGSLFRAQTDGRVRITKADDRARGLSTPTVIGHDAGKPRPRTHT